MADTTNYIPKRPAEIEIPSFLSSNNTSKVYETKGSEIAYMRDDIDEISREITTALEQGREANAQQSNMFHLKELDKVADAYNEEEARVIIKRLVSNYPDIVLGEVANLIQDMQELSASIMKNSKIFASKRGEV